MFVDEDGSGGEESGSGCEGSDCVTDIYFSTPPNPEKPRVNPVKVPEGGSAASQGSLALALCGVALALLAPHWR